MAAPHQNPAVGSAAEVTLEALLRRILREEVRAVVREELNAALAERSSGSAAAPSPAAIQPTYLDTKEAADAMG